MGKVVSASRAGMIRLMQDRPNQTELLETISDFFDDELLPNLDGPLRYRALVAANLVRILARESRSGVQSLHGAHKQLSVLLGDSVDEQLAPEDTTSKTHALAAELARRLDDHDESLDLTQAWRVLMDITRAKLAIARPGYDRWDSSTEQPQDG